MQTKARFITLEGVEGAGKSTAIQFISDYLKQENIAHIITREPGGTKIAERIRQLLLNNSDEIMAKDTELLLMFAARAQHLDQVILPALNNNQWVISDRFTDASYAYQGGGRGIAVERIAALENWVQGNFRPDLTLLLDIPVEIGMERINSRGNADRIEQEKIEFFERVRVMYLKRAELNPKQYRILNANCALTQLQAQLKNILIEVIQNGN